MPERNTPESKLPPVTGNTWTDRILRLIEPIIFGRRKATHVALLLITVWLGFEASKTHVDAGWIKSIPLDHPYMQTFQEYYDKFGGANRVIVAVMAQDGDIYNKKFLDTLKAVHDEVFFLPGVDRTRVASIFAPGVQYVEVIEGGLQGAPVMPSNYLAKPDFQPPDEMLEKIRSNVGKGHIIGRLIADQQNGALVVGELLEINPQTLEKLDYPDFAAKLEALRTKYEDEQISIHIIGFAKVVGDITDAALEVIGFFGMALLLTVTLLWLYLGTFRLSMLPLGCAIVAVIWEFGLLTFAGFGLDPFAILVPFLVLSVSVSHGVQYTNAWVAEVDAGRSSYDASLATFRRLAIPGTVALITDVAGFATIYLINIEIIQEMSINAAFGVAAIIITNKMLMPIWLTYVKIPDMKAFREKQIRREHMGAGLWHTVAKITRPFPALCTIGICCVLAGWGLWKYPSLQIGDAQEGVPELRPDSRYNQDARVIVNNFDMGTDVMTVIAETEANACIKYPIMEELDRFVWHMQNTEGVGSAMSLLTMSRAIYSGLNDGRLNAEIVPRNRYALGQVTSMVPPSAGLKTNDCSAMAVLIFTENHKAQTIEHIVRVVNDFNANHSSGRIRFRLASGNVGVMAATNEVIEAEELPVVGWVYAVIVLFLWLSFRTSAGVLCVVLPLSLVSLLSYGLMAVLGIGLKVATLPVVALAVGIGVDYGIYIYSTIQEGIRRGLSLQLAYERTLHKTGKAVVFTGIALGGSVSTWLLSGLQFQVDMGMLLVFMFTANMFGAILVLPALARFLMQEGRAELVGTRRTIDQAEEKQMIRELRRSSGVQE